MKRSNFPSRKPLITLLAMILFCILIMCIPGKGQSWLKPTKREMLSYPTLIISGISNGVREGNAALHFGSGSKFTDYRNSWKNKYRDYDNGDMSAAYPGSKTYLAFTTDLYHLSGTANKTFLTLGILFNTWDLRNELKEGKGKRGLIILRRLLYGSISYNVPFAITYNNL